MTISVGLKYEEHVKHFLIQKHGFKHEKHTGGSGDGGVDLIMIDPNNKRVAIQCKYISKGTVGSKVAGEIHKGTSLEKADYGMICSNAPFSNQCQDECSQLEIELKIIKMDSFSY